MISHLTTAIPGTATDHDVATFLWNTGWVREALQNQKSLLETDAVLLPFGADLRLHTYSLLQGLAAYPFTAILGVVGAFNLVLIVSLWLNGAAVYAFIYDEVKQTSPALIAAVLVMFGTPALAQYRVGRPSFAALWIIALALLALRRLLARPAPGNTIGLGLLLLAALLSDYQILFYTALWLALYGLYWLVQCGRNQPAIDPTSTRTRLLTTMLRSCILAPKRLAALLISGGILLVPFLFFYYPALDSAGTGSFPQPGLQGMNDFSFAIKYYVQWPVVPLIYGGYVLFLALIIALLTIRRRWVSWFWLLASAVFLMLALGPYLHPTDITLPFAGFSNIPMLRQFRTPYRMTIPALIGLGLISGSLLAAWWPSLQRKRWLASAVLIILLGGRLYFAITHDPFNIQIYPAYDFYEQLGREPGDFAILEVPFGVRSGLGRIGQGGEILSYYQHIHHKPLLNGMIARLPHEVFQFYRAQPVLPFLSGEPTTVPDERLRQNLIDVLAWSRTCYIAVHPALLPNPETAEAILTFLDTTPDLHRHTQEPDLITYALTTPSAHCPP